MIIQKLEKSGRPFDQYNFNKGDVFSINDNDLYVVIGDWKGFDVEVFSLESRMSMIFSKDEDTVYYKVTKLAYEI